MQRRKFLKVAGIGLASTAVAAPALAQSTSPTKWRLTTTFPKSLDTLYGACELFAKLVGELSDQKFQVQVFAPGEVVPPFQVFDAVSTQTIELGNTASYYYIGKDPAFAFGTAVPFGLNTRQMNAWLSYGGGLDLLNDLYKSYNVMAIPFGNTTAQMGGWFRKEIKTLDDIKGLKFRVGGIAGQVLSRLGVVPQQIAPGDIYPSLEKGTIDAAEWIGPYDDEKLGFVKIAPYYYYPGWWEGQAMLHAFINLEKWESLPKTYKAVLQAACAYANVDMMAKYDARNPAALRRLAESGAKLSPFSTDVLEACFKAANEVFDETSKNPEYPMFGKVLEAMKAVRGDQYLWFQLSEYNFDTFMMIQQRKKTI